MSWGLVQNIPLGVVMFFETQKPRITLRLFHFKKHVSTSEVILQQRRKHAFYFLNRYQEPKKESIYNPQQLLTFFSVECVRKFTSFYARRTNNSWSNQSRTKPHPIWGLMNRNAIYFCYEIWKTFGDLNIKVLIMLFELCFILSRLVILEKYLIFHHAWLK